MELILPRVCSRNEAIRWILLASLASIPRYGHTHEAKYLGL